MRFAAWLSLVQVKQWANSAVAIGVPRGRSSRPASSVPAAPRKVKSSVAMVPVLVRVIHPGLGGAAGAGMQAGQVDASVTDAPRPLAPAVLRARVRP